jgi:hypothetical protein
MGRVRHLVAASDRWGMDMKPSRFTEEQIIGILREQEDGRRAPQTRDQQRDLLQVEGQIRRAGLRSQAADSKMSLHKGTEEALRQWQKRSGNALPENASQPPSHA